MDWFTSDTHFSQTSVLEQSRRPFGTLDRMNYRIIQNWNSVVGDNDRIFILGDFGYPGIIRKLKGKEIVLIRGNHDTKAVIAALSKDKRFRLGKINELWDGLHFFKMVHKPCRAKSPKAFYLHGHSHNGPKTKFNGLNVCIDLHEYAPISLDEVLWWKDSILNRWDSCSGNYREQVLLYG